MLSKSLFWKCSTIIKNFQRWNPFLKSENLNQFRITMTKHDFPIVFHFWNSFNYSITSISFRRSGSQVFRPRPFPYFNVGKKRRIDLSWRLKSSRRSEQLMNGRGMVFLGGWREYTSSPYKFPSLQSGQNIKHYYKNWVFLFSLNIF